MYPLLPHQCRLLQIIPERSGPAGRSGPGCSETHSTRNSRHCASNSKISSYSEVSPMPTEFVWLARLLRPPCQKMRPAAWLCSSFSFSTCPMICCCPRLHPRHRPRRLPFPFPGRSCCAVLDSRRGFFPETWMICQEWHWHYFAALIVSSYSSPRPCLRSRRPWRSLCRPPPWHPACEPWCYSFRRCQFLTSPSRGRRLRTCS
mmetsp:Transcript_27462/g.66017  ORF Transcript_27462/g.66017 Transcript_27462/m.66017 type:complete len:203 (-) Transcript_27462:92-700(-)